MSMQANSVGREVRRLAEIGGPVALTQLGAMMLGVVDMLMLGRVGVHELDASALGNLWIFGTIIVGMGTVFGMDPLVSQAHGAGDGERVGRTLQQGLVVSLILSVPTALAWFATGPVLGAMGQDAVLVADAHTYVVWQIPSIPFFLGYLAIRQYLQGRGLVTPGLWVIVVANLFNVAANWALIWGIPGLGIPALGLTGAALATSATKVFSLVGMWAWTVGFGLHRGAWTGWSWAAFDPRGLGAIFRVGLPVGLQYGLEGWAFQVATLFSGWIGKTELAAHVVVLNLASVSFMLPLGVSIGAAVRVGNLIGAGHAEDADRSAWISFAMGGGVMVVSAIGFVAARELLPALYVDDPAVIALAASVLPVAAAFQLFDGVQVVGGGILRGMGNTRPAAVFNLFGYYALGLPLAYVLGFHTALGVVGIWWGLALGLAVVAVSLMIWVKVRPPSTASAIVTAELAG